MVSIIPRCSPRTVISTHLASGSSAFWDTGPRRSVLSPGTDCPLCFCTLLYFNTSVVRQSLAFFRTHSNFLCLLACHSLSWLGNPPHHTCYNLFILLSLSLFLHLSQAGRTPCEGTGHISGVWLAACCVLCCVLLWMKTTGR